jgi:hypothetical protein
MALKTMLKRITDAKKKYDAELKKAGKNVKKEIAKSLGALVPEGFFLEWDQYTPYFNDGEPCVFSINTPWLKSVKPMPDAPEGVKTDDEDDDETAEEPTLEGDVAGPDEVFEAEAEDQDDGESAERDVEEAEERDWGDYEEDAGTFELWDAKFIKAADLNAVGVKKKQVKALLAAFKELPEEVLQSAYGDHVAIRIYADGTYRCEECSHG